MKESPFAPSLSSQAEEGPATPDGGPAEPVRDVLRAIRRSRTVAIPTPAEVAALTAACGTTSTEEDEAAQALLLDLASALSHADGTERTGGVPLAVAVAACDAGAPFLLVSGLRDAAAAASSSQQHSDDPCPPDQQQQLTTTSLWLALASLTAADRELNVRRIADAGAAALAAEQMPRLLASFPSAVPFAAAVICSCFRALPVHPQCSRSWPKGGCRRGLLSSRANLALIAPRIDGSACFAS